jgi:hypothetical protein
MIYREIRQTSHNPVDYLWRRRMPPPPSLGPKPPSTSWCGPGPREPPRAIVGVKMRQSQKVEARPSLSGPSCCHCRWTGVLLVTAIHISPPPRPNPRPRRSSTTAVPHELCPTTPRQRRREERCVGGRKRHIRISYHHSIPLNGCVHLSDAETRCNPFK